jgi:hypothetical protein
MRPNVHARQPSRLLPQNAIVATTSLFARAARDQQSRRSVVVVL